MYNEINAGGGGSGGGGRGVGVGACVEGTKPSSMRQIMAEQMADVMRSKIDASASISSSINQHHHHHHHQQQQQQQQSTSGVADIAQADESKHVGNVVKLRYLYDKYSNHVDKQMLTNILKSFRSAICNRYFTTTTTTTKNSKNSAKSTLLLSTHLESNPTTSTANAYFVHTPKSSCLIFAIKSSLGALHIYFEMK